ncbi:MAG: hypothetical protein GY820_44505 [Gammaproteobacteria bacterium]|nr:hypothetical protein [Gammaproteobacteria bacterium]
MWKKGAVGRNDPKTPRARNLGKRSDLGVVGTVDDLAGIPLDLGSQYGAGNLDLGKNHNLKLRKSLQSKSRKGERPCKGSCNLLREGLSPKCIHNLPREGLSPKCIRNLLREGQGLKVNRDLRKAKVRC